MDDPIDNTNIADLAKEYAENLEKDSNQNIPSIKKSLIAWEKIKKRKRDEELWRRQLQKIWKKI